MSSHMSTAVATNQICDEYITTTTTKTHQPVLLFMALSVFAINHTLGRVDDSSRARNDNKSRHDSNTSSSILAPRQIRHFLAPLGSKCGKGVGSFCVAQSPESVLLARTVSDWRVQKLNSHHLHLIIPCWLRTKHRRVRFVSIWHVPEWSLHTCIPSNYCTTAHKHADDAAGPDRWPNHSGQCAIACDVRAQSHLWNCDASAVTVCECG